MSKLPNEIDVKTYEKFLGQLGIVLIRIKGSHRHYNFSNKEKYQLLRNIIISTHNSVLRKEYILNDLEVLGIKREVFSNWYYKKQKVKYVLDVREVLKRKYLVSKK